MRSLKSSDLRLGFMHRYLVGPANVAWGFRPRIKCSSLDVGNGGESALPDFQRTSAALERKMRLIPMLSQ
ncbi:unnamed protein product [Sphagnum balticum]